MRSSRLFFAMCSLLSLAIQAAENKPASYVIPGFKVPISFHKKNEISKSSLILQACCTVAPHIYLLYAQTKGGAIPLQNQLLQHLLLHLGKHVVGLLTTTTHELGHAVVQKRLDFVTEGPDIKIFYSPISMFSGMYAGVTDCEEEDCLGIKSLNKDKESSSIVTTKQEYLAWAERYQDRCVKTIINCVAGPIVGLVAAPALAYTVASMQPYVMDVAVSKGTLVALLSGAAIFQNLLNLYPWNKGYDGSKALRCYKAIQETKDIAKQVAALPDDAQVVLDFD